jgi:hypothetical protein
MHVHQFGDFFFQVGQSCFERFAMVGIRGGFQVVHDAGAGELQVFALLLAMDLVGAFALSVSSLWCLAGFHLGFDVLAFPSPCHDNNILTHLAGRTAGKNGIISQRK